MVYTGEPQGLLNSGEHAYERLGRIFGDMCAREQMTRMADGLYILADTYADLLDNFREVLQRLKISNLTIKPSKVVVCPNDIILFGWRKCGDAWSPTAHTTLPLVNAQLPNTVKQLRSWLGSYKQLASCIQNYAIPLKRLEMLTGSDKSSAAKIDWTEQLKNDFQDAKSKIKQLEEVYTPKPTDLLQTYSDFSDEHKAIGGRLLINRMVDGKMMQLNGGYYSARLNKFQTRWLPCEGEALGCKLVLEHFAPSIRENNNQHQHFTDSLPCVHAARKAKLGAFSSSARISTFLSSISHLNVEFHHTAGKSIKLVDYISRHPNACNDKGCQICKFNSEMVKIGDNAVNLNEISIKEVMDGKIKIPFAQKNTWLQAQNEDGTHATLKQLINTSQAPQRKKTKNENTKLKLLHNLYREGKLKIAKDGLITVKNTDQNGRTTQAISVPTKMFPGLMHALHRKFDHPSKQQLTKLAAKFFYAPGYHRVIEEVTDACDVCTATKQLPKELFAESTSTIEGLGTNFSADIIERDKQQILIVREKLSSFTRTQFVKDQSAETLQEALISLIIDIRNLNGTTVQTDCATAWAKLSKDAPNSPLKKLNIKIDMGRTHNRNKNPIIDNACREFHKECLRLKPNGGQISEIERAIITDNLNQRIRVTGFSSRQIYFQRDDFTGEHNCIDDSRLAKEIEERRMSAHNIPTATQDESIKVGDNVMLKDDKNKLKGREPYHVVDINEELDPMTTVQKQDNQFRAKRYKVKRSELIKMPNQPENDRDITEENTQAVIYQDLKDEIMNDKPTILATLIVKKLKERVFNKAPGDYEALLKQIEEDDDMVFLKQGPNYQQHRNAMTNGDSLPIDESVDSLTPDQLSNDTTDSWLLPTPNNSYTDESDFSLPVDNLALAEALQSVANDLLTFNASHPTQPGESLRRSQRQVSKPISYVYNGRRIPTRRK